MTPDRFRERRTELGLSQNQVAALARVSARTVLRVEAGQCRNPNTLRKICIALEIAPTRPHHAREEIATQSIVTIGPAGYDVTPTLVNEFHSIAAQIPCARYLAIPDVDAFARQGRPHWTHVIAALQPRAILHALALTPTISTAISAAVLITFALALIWNSTPFKVMGMPSCGLLLAIALIEPVSLIVLRLTHHAQTKALARTAYVFGDSAIHAIIRHRSGIVVHRLRNDGPNALHKIACGSSWIYGYGPYRLLRAIPDDKRLIKCISDQIFRSHQMLDIPGRNMPPIR